MSERKFILAAFVFIFVVISLIFSWKDLSWFFNYHYISYAFGDEEPTAQPEALSNVENSIEIPKIGIKAPLVIPDGKDPTLKNELNQGVAYYPESALPGEKGQTIILGHSAPPDWPKIKYDWVFNDLNKLEPGDEIFVYFNGKKNTYKVSKNYIINRGEELAKNTGKNTLVLMSCWPPGKDFKRMAVEAELSN